MNYFGEPSKRIARMREELLSAKPQVCVERAIHTTEAYKDEDSEESLCH